MTRWQPPSMKQAPKVKVDEQVVRKMLKVNPALRAGRTTGQVKRALESGQPLLSQPAQPAPSAPAADVAGQLRDTVRFFVSGKAEGFAALSRDIEARKKALDDELAAARAALREQLVAFVKLLDRDMVLANEALLRELGLDAKVIADAVRNKR